MPYFLVQRQWSKGGYHCLTCNLCCYLHPHQPCASGVFTVFLDCTPQSLTSAMVNHSKPPHHVAGQTPTHFLSRLPTFGTDLLLATSNVVASGVSTTAFWSSSVSLTSCLWSGEKILALHASKPSTGKPRGRNSQQNYWLIHLFSFTILSREYGHLYQGRIKHTLMLFPVWLAGSFLMMILFSPGPYISSLCLADFLLGLPVPTTLLSLNQ